MRNPRHLLCLLICLMIGISAAAAQPSPSWPTKRIRGIVPVGAGSAIDLIARTLFEPLSESLGQPIVVENRTGAGGTIGAIALAQAEPDGYTLMVQSWTLTLSPYLYANLPYDTEKDILPVGDLATLPNVLLVARSKKINTIEEFVAAAKAKPGALTYGSSGAGTSTHIQMERFGAAAGFTATHVPFRGAVEALTEVIAGRVYAYFTAVPVALPQIRAGTVVPLVVVASRRSSALPDIPTLAEAGYPAANDDVWAGLFTRGGTPAEIVDKLRQASQAVTASDAYRQGLARLGAEPPSMSPEEFRKKVFADLAANGAILRTMGIVNNGAK